MRHRGRRGRDVYRANKDAVTTKSVALLVAEVGDADEVGIYRCDRLFAKTASGRELLFDPLPEVEFEVVAEPESPVQLVRASFADL